MNTINQSGLFSPLTLRGLTLRNRIGISPMCMYSCEDGLATDWHMVHLGSRAVGGAGLIIAEAAGISPEGRISPGCLGIWSQAHAEALAPVTAFIRGQGSVAGIQLGHAGRKASTQIPWQGRDAVPLDRGGWQVVGPDATPFSERNAPPKAMNAADIAKVTRDFAEATRLSIEAGFEFIEVHGAHGYLLSTFLSPLSNSRTDDYGGSLKNRARFMIEVAQAIRAILPERLPLSFRLSVTDWVEGGLTIEDTVEVSRWLKDAGVDVIDCSSGSVTKETSTYPESPGYRVPFAEKIRKEAGIATAAVGMISEPEQAEAIIAEGRADLVLLARASLRDPFWGQHAAKALGVPMTWAAPYNRVLGDRPTR